jgi:hypothetical protein
MVTIVNSLTHLERLLMKLKRDRMQNRKCKVTKSYFRSRRSNDKVKFAQNCPRCILMSWRLAKDQIIGRKWQTDGVKEKKKKLCK